MEKNFNIQTKTIFDKINILRSAAAYKNKDDISKAKIDKWSDFCEDCVNNGCKAVVGEEEIEEIIELLGMTYVEVVEDLPWYEPYAEPKREILYAILHEVTEINHNLKLIKA